MNAGSSHMAEGLNNLSNQDSLLDEVSVENNVSEENDFSNSDFGSSSFVSDSPMDLQSDTLWDVITSGLGFLISEREQNRQDGSLLQVDVVSVSSNVLSPYSAEISSREARRNSRRLFWDAFSRRNSRRHVDSRTFSPSDSDHMRSHDRWLLDSSSGSSDDNGGDARSRGGRTLRSSEQRMNSRSEIWDRLRGGLDSTNHITAVCPRGIHTEGSCSCHTSSSSSVEESGSRAGISRIVMLAEALFEVARLLYTNSGAELLYQYLSICHIPLVVCDVFQCSMPYALLFVSLLSFVFVLITSSSFH